MATKLTHSTSARSLAPMADPAVLVVMLRDISSDMARTADDSLLRRLAEAKQQVASIATPAGMRVALRILEDVIIPCERTYTRMFFKKPVVHDIRAR